MKLPLYTADRNKFIVNIGNETIVVAHLGQNNNSADKPAGL